MKLSSSAVVFTALDVKTRKPVRPKTVQFAVDATSNWKARVDGKVQLLIVMNLDLARKASRLLRRSATRAEQWAARIAERDLRAATAAKRRIPRSKSPAIAGKRPARKRSTLKKSAGVAAEVLAGRKL